jgi:hypothetical protein
MRCEMIQMRMAKVALIQIQEFTIRTVNPPARADSISSRSRACEHSDLNFPSE